MKKVNLAAVLVLFLSLTAHANNQSADFAGSDAQAFYQTLGLSPGNDSGYLVVSGYLTEKNSPPVMYTDMTLTVNGQSVQRKLSDDQITELGEILTEPGRINANYDGSGGTTLVGVNVNFSCNVNGGAYSCHVAN